MTISEWLHKLNLNKYISRFTKKNVHFVEDIAASCCTDGRLNELIHFRKDELADKLRIQKMINLEEMSKNDFRYL